MASASKRVKAASKPAAPSAPKSAASGSGDSDALKLFQAGARFALALEKRKSKRDSKAGADDKGSDSEDESARAATRAAAAAAFVARVSALLQRLRSRSDEKKQAPAPPSAVASHPAVAVAVELQWVMGELIKAQQRLVRQPPSSTAPPSLLTFFPCAARYRAKKAAPASASSFASYFSLDTLELVHLLLVQPSTSLAPLKLEPVLLVLVREAIALSLTSSSPAATTHLSHASSVVTHLFRSPSAASGAARPSASASASAAPAVVASPVTGAPPSLNELCTLLLLPILTTYESTWAQQPTAPGSSEQQRAAVWNVLSQVLRVLEGLCAASSFLLLTCAARRAVCVASHRLSEAAAQGSRCVRANVQHFAVSTACAARGCRIARGGRSAARSHRRSGRRRSVPLRSRTRLRALHSCTFGTSLTVHLSSVTVFR
jgi:hypothetical protein